MTELEILGEVQRVQEPRYRERFEDEVGELFAFEHVSGDDLGHEVDREELVGHGKDESSREQVDERHCDGE